MKFKIYLWSNSKAMADSEKGENRDTNVWISQNENCFLDEIKKHFSLFLKKYRLVKKNWWKADTSFKYFITNFSLAHFIGQVEIESPLISSFFRLGSNLKNIFFLKRALFTQTLKIPEDSEDSWTRSCNFEVEIFLFSVLPWHRTVQNQLFSNLKYL